MNQFPRTDYPVNRKKKVKHLMIFTPTYEPGFCHHEIKGPEIINGAFEKFFQHVISGENLTHVATLDLDSDLWPCFYNPCGRQAICYNTNEFKKGRKIFQFYEPDRKANLLCCPKGSCHKIFFGDSKNRINVLFHLMLKQVFPSENFAYYLDCFQISEKRLSHCQDNSKDRKRIRDLGTISFITGLGSDEVGMGFFIEPKMDTANVNKGFDRYDAWARFLFSKKMEQLREFEKFNRQFIDGPSR